MFFPPHLASPIEPPAPSAYMLFPTAPLCSSLSWTWQLKATYSAYYRLPGPTHSPISSDGAHKADWAAFPGADTTQEVPVRGPQQKRVRLLVLGPPDFQGIQGWVPQLHFHEGGRKGRVSGCSQVV